MNNPLFRIVLADELLPVQAFFNALPDDIFLSLLQKVLDGVGVDYNGVGCVLPGEDDDSAPDKGVLFYVGEEQKWLPDDQVAAYLEEAVAAFLKTHPGECDRADALLREVRVTLK